MRVLVLGSGAREHALAWKLASSRTVKQVFVGPGNAGTSAVATNLPGVRPLDFPTVVDACRGHGIDCVFVGPEVPLAAGVVDHLRSAGIPAIGPDKRAAQLESSKTFSKTFLVRNALPTASAAEFSNLDDFERYVRRAPPGRLVVKKSGLAAGKGVLESSDHDELLSFGAGILKDDSLLVEEFLEGWEVSIFGLSDGTGHIVLPPCTDFKKAHDGDKGPNTGGMGSICPVPWVSASLMQRIRNDVVAPTYAALNREGLGYAGVLYFGLMITARGPQILEFNVRFGDPETQVLMPMLGYDLGDLVKAMAGGGIESVMPSEGPGPGAALGVVIASRGYPEHPETGAAVAPLSPPPADGSMVFHASTSVDAAGVVRVGGGRCFTAVGVGSDLASASRRAHAVADTVRFDGAWHRNDIGRKFIDNPNPGACG